MGKRKPRDAADEADGLDEETRLARAVEKAREATKRRNASLFAESALPGAGRRPEANYGDRWEVEEALATVAGGAEVAATLGMAHPDLAPRPAGISSVDDAAVPDADLDPAERGYHDPEPGELWVKTLDLDSGEHYYFNPRTRETTWDQPPPGSRVQLDERAAKAEADARAMTTRKTSEDEGNVDDDEAVPEPSPANATAPSETQNPKPRARQETTTAVERLWAAEDARRRATEPDSAAASIGEGTAGVWAARAAAAAAAGADAAAAELPSDDFVLEGRVSEKFDVRPASLTDEAYRQVSLRRMEEATRKTRVMQDAKGPQRVVPLPKARNLVARLDGKDPAEKVRHERMEKAPLEDKLMGLFERRNLWSFKQLVEETRQPAVWLKEVLSELAVLNRRGPNTGQWTLKDMYKKKGAGGVVE